MIDPKRMLTNGVFCPIPWTGLMYNYDGTVKNCIRASGAIGDLKKKEITDILLGDINLVTQTRMLDDQPGQTCDTCYEIEHGKKNLDIISDRIFYLRELKHVDRSLYEPKKHDLKVIDIRWSNLCNFSCVYCGPDFSSRWAKELGIYPESPTPQQIEKFKNWVLERSPGLRHVYLAGGEPLLMKENLEILEHLLRVNPSVNLRINTNLSKVDTKIFETICRFQNVHWTISIESLEKEFEYIRYGGNWKDFLENLDIITGLSHRITFNMLYFLLNHRSLFDCVDFLIHKSFHPNSFVVGALLSPVYLNIRHLPDNMLNSISNVLEQRISQAPGYLLEDSYRNLLHYIRQPFEKNLSQSLQKIAEIDARRGIDSRQIFKDLYELI